MVCIFLRLLANCTTPPKWQIARIEYETFLPPKNTKFAVQCDLNSSTFQTLT